MSSSFLCVFQFSYIESIIIYVLDNKYRISITDVKEILRQIYNKM